VPGEWFTVPVRLGEREAMMGDGGAGSGWVIDLPAERIPCDKLRVWISDAEFARTYRLDSGGPAGSNLRFRPVHRGDWSRRAGEAMEPMEATLSSELVATRLRLVVTDHRNPPLAIERAELVGAARQIVFARSAELRPPLRLYLGNPKAQPPNYDLARQLPPRLDPVPVRLEHGPRQLNPDYVPPPKPLTERWPWLVYVALGTAALALAALLLHLARTAIAQHDAQDPSPRPASL
jgi:hypothetical protein